MARKKCKCPPKEEGAPAWVMTYGDMMSLLLTFFIILVALSEIKKEDQYRAIVEEVQKSFGMKGGGGKLPTKDDPELSLIDQLETIQLKRRPVPQLSNAEDPGMDGRESTVTKIREDMQFVTGGRITFEPGSAELTDRAKARLRRVGELLRGETNVIELRGHAASREAGNAADYEDEWALSVARARAAKDYVVSPELGLDPRRIRIVGCSDNEPLKTRVYTSFEKQPNRRVEVFRSNALIQQFNRPEVD